MAILAKRTIKDRLAAGDNKYLVEQLEDGRIKLTPAPDEVSEEGTAINADLLQPLEDARVEHATAIENKMDKSNPTGTGSFSLNRKPGTTTGDYSFAEGYHTTAPGYASHAEGDTTSAPGYASHAEGFVTTADSEVSHAEGFGTIAASQCQHVQGKYNIEDSSDTYADIIGNGTSDTERSNAAIVDWSGNAWYAGDVYVGSTSGTNKDEGSKKLATAEYVDSAVSGGLPLGISGATVDQTVKIKSVDENGVPTEWDAVSIYKGEAEEIASATTTEPVKTLSLNVDSNGNAFSLKHWTLIISAQPHSNVSTDPYYWAYASLTLPGGTNTVTIKSNLGGTAAVFQGDSESGAGWCTYPATYNDNTGTQLVYWVSAPLTGVEIISSPYDDQIYLPQGMKVTIMGVRE